MIKHVVIINFEKKFNINYQALLEETKPLILSIPGVLKYEIFKNESHYTSENIISFGVEINFENWSALEVFMTHSNHFDANRRFEKYLATPPFMVLTYETNST